MRIARVYWRSCGLKTDESVWCLRVESLERRWRSRSSIVLTHLAAIGSRDILVPRSREVEVFQSSSTPSLMAWDGLGTEATLLQAGDALRKPATNVIRPCFSIHSAILSVMGNFLLLGPMSFRIPVLCISICPNSIQFKREDLRCAAAALSTCALGDGASAKCSRLDETKGEEHS